MNKTLTIVCTVLSFFAVTHVGCSNATTATVSTSNGLTTATRLALGTLKLEGTDQALTASQVAELLTLWQGYQSLSNSDTTSPVELDALVSQIQGVMTAEQTTAIDGMNLTNQSLSEELQSLGTSVYMSSPASTPDSSTLSQAAPMGGPGGIPGGSADSVMNQIGDGTTAQSAASVTQSILNAQTTRVDAMLLTALIQMLEARSEFTG